jgi:hypothetical protein
MGICARCGERLGGAGHPVEHSEDQQILDSLATGTITMPLWGVSLDKAVAEHFGSRFTFELVGKFPAIPAWANSGIKEDEQELIVGGTYAVEGVQDDADGRTVARLRFVSVVPVGL